MHAQLFWCPAALIEEDWNRNVLINVDASGKISTIKQEVPSADVDTTCQRLNGVVVAGMPNLHSHAHQRAMAGLAERATQNRDSFWSWRRMMYQMVEKIEAEDLYHIACMLYIEMLEAGYTRVAEFQYLHHDPRGKPYANRAEMTLQCRQAARDTGIAFTALPVLYQFGGFGSEPATDGQRRFLNDVDGFAAIVESIRSTSEDRETVGIAPHSLRAIDRSLLRSAIELVAADGVIHIHIAEQIKEVEDCIAWSAARPVQWLLEHFEVGSRWCLIHATHMCLDEINRLAGSGAVAGLCPTTEANLGDGFFAARDFLDHGGRFGIGSDSQIIVDPAEELRLLEYGERLQQQRRAVLGSAQIAQGHVGVSLYNKAVAGGNQACGLGQSGLRVGAAADFVVLDSEHPRLGGKSPSGQLDSWVFATSGGAVSDVFVAGNRVVADHRHPSRDKICQNFFKTVNRLHA